LKIRKKLRTASFNSKLTGFPKYIYVSGVGNLPSHGFPKYVY